MSVVSLDDVKKHLNISGSTHNDELDVFIDAAEAVLAQHVGPLEPVAVTSRVKGGRENLVLPVAPVVSLTSVATTSGSLLTLDDYDLDTATGLVSNALGGCFGYGPYDVTYQAGRTTVPADLKLAVMELVRHMWQTQRGPTQRPGSTASEQASNTVPGAGYLLPFRVLELIGPHTHTGVA